jgi:hypothetical protein
MNTALAMEYIPRRMLDLGYGNKYYIRFVQLSLQPSEIRLLNATSEFFILVEEPNNVSVDSDMGIYDPNLPNVNEMQYEHQGVITITNQLPKLNTVQFIQVVPKENNRTWK